MSQRRRTPGLAGWYRRPVTKVLLLADTHLGPGQADRLLARIGELVATADAIVHAGDITDPSILAALGAFAPVHAVLGNNDHGVVLPQQIQVEIGGCQVAVVHDSGPSSGRTQRLRRWFPAADVVVFGHSHAPWHEVDVSPATGQVQHHVNPGSAMQRRAQPRCTAAWLHLDHGEVAAVTHIPLT